MLDEVKFQQLLDRRQESGLNVKSFCSNEGIAESTYYYWIKKFRRKVGVKSFIPLVVNPSGTTVRRQQHKSIPETNPDDTTREDNNYLLEIVYPNGTRLRIKHDLDINSLRSLVYLFD